MNRIYNRSRFIDLNSIIQQGSKQVSIILDDYSLNDLPLSNKNVNTFVYHCLISLVFDEILINNTTYQNVIYVDKSYVKNLTYIQMFDVLNFCKLYKKLIKTLKLSMGLRVISTNYSLDTFISGLSSNNSKMFDMYNDVQQKTHIPQCNVVKFFEYNGLSQVKQRYKANETLKMCIAV